MLDQILSQELKNYILNATTEEDPLLCDLRQETAQTTPFASMLTGPIEGRFLTLLVQLMNAKMCLEVGTFTGYSALCIAAGLPSEGKLITCEARTHHAVIAKKYFDLSPHGYKIELCLGHATQTIQQFKTIFDFIFIDADKINYLFYYDTLIPMLRPGGLMVIDNTLWKGTVLDPQQQNAQAVHALNMKAKNDPRVETVMLAIRDGMLLIRKR